MLAALALKNVSYEYKPVDLLKGEQFKDEIFAMNPMRMVPFMVFEDGHGPQIIAQSMAIIDYLEQVVPSPPLWPKNLIDRANAITVAEIVNSSIQPLQNKGPLDTLAELGVDKIEFANNVITKGFEALEIILSKTSGKYCIGDEVTIADIFLAPQILNGSRYRVDISKFPTLNRINNSLLELDCFKQTHPNNQPDAE